MHGAAATCQINIHIIITSTCRAPAEMLCVFWPKVSIAQSITQLLPACLLPIVHSGARCFPGKNTHAPADPHDVKKNKTDSSDQPPSFVDPWSSSNDHMPICDSFGPIHSKLQTVFLTTALTQANLHSPHASLSLGLPVGGSFLGPHLIDSSDPVV